MGKVASAMRFPWGVAWQRRSWRERQLCLEIALQIQQHRFLVG